MMNTVQQLTNSRESAQASGGRKSPGDVRRPQRNRCAVSIDAQFGTRCAVARTQTQRACAAVTLGPHQPAAAGRSPAFCELDTSYAFDARVSIGPIVSWTTRSAR